MKERRKGGGGTGEEETETVQIGAASVIINGLLATCRGEGGSENKKELKLAVAGTNHPSYPDAPFSSNGSGSINCGLFPEGNKAMKKKSNI